jgi:predicted glycosyltransferase
VNKDRRPKVLVAPLDWGLGHATRCIPIIRELLNIGCEVTLAGEGAVAALLRSNFPQLQILNLKGYRMRYSRTASGFASHILMQIPKILRTISHERKWLKELHHTHHFDLVVSDNRYGLKISGLQSVIITHQLQILTGKGQLADKLLLRLHRKILDQFDACWVADKAGVDNLSGILSHPDKIPSNAVYVGLLSQFAKPTITIEPGSNEILILLSGPEPMRGILEEKILGQVEKIKEYKFHLVAGNPLGVKPADLPPHLEYHTHLNAQALDKLLQRCELVVCRGGYSTLMDLAILGKKALLIPTPGQTEQLYLANRLQQLNRCYYVDQNELNLAVHIPTALDFAGFEPETDPVNLRDVITKTLSAALSEA